MDWKQEGSAVLGADEASLRAVSAVTNQGANALAIDQGLPRLPYELAVRLPAQPDIQALCVWLYEPVRQAIRLHVLMADLPARVRTGMDFPVEDSIAGWVWQHQQPLTINTDAETRFPKFARALLETGIKSFCGVPLLIGNRRIGVLGLASTKPSAFRDFKLQFMQRRSPEAASVAAVRATASKRTAALRPADETLGSSGIRLAPMPTHEEPSHLMEDIFASPHRYLIR